MPRRYILIGNRVFRNTAQHGTRTSRLDDVAARRLRWKPE
jgi:hypothetical protein